MAVAYRRRVLYTEPQLRALRLIQQMQRPTLTEVFRCIGGRCVDTLFCKGALEHHGDTLILTTHGQWAAARTTQRIVQYQRKGDNVELELDELPPETDMMDDEIVAAEGMESAGREQMADLKRDCLDYHKDQGRMPQPEDVCAWAEIVCVRLSQRQAQHIINMAEKVVNGNGKRKH